MKIEIGAYEAKTRLPELLRQVKAGKRFTITHRGVAIADLVPSEKAMRENAQASVEAMRGFSRIRGVSGDTIKAWIAEGRQ